MVHTSWLEHLNSLHGHFRKSSSFPAKKIKRNVIIVVVLSCWSKDHEVTKEQNEIRARQCMMLYGA
jgi:hypothetical protein